MSKQSNAKDDLREAIQLEFSLIKSSDTMSGILFHLKSLFDKFQKILHLNQIICHIEKQINEEDQKAFQSLEKAVNWFRDKLERLMPCVQSKERVNEINSSLKYEVFVLSAGGYLGHLNSLLRSVVNQVLKDADSHSLFNDWAKIEMLPCGEWYVSEYIFPVDVEQELDKEGAAEAMYRWKEQIDSSLSSLYRFLKTLSFCESFVPLTIGGPSDIVPKDLQEFEQRQYQGHVGLYLSAFKSSDVNTHPISKDELIRLVERFLLLLEKEIESSVASHGTSSETNIHWRSRQALDDMKALVPLGKKMWVDKISQTEHPQKLGRKSMAEELLAKLPCRISLHSKGRKRLPRVLKAIECTDPRLPFKNGKYVGLRPHWQKFDWVEF